MHKTPRLLNAATYNAKREHHMQLHQHRAWELVYYRRGAIRSRMGDRVLRSRAGQLWLTPPRVSHAEFADTAYENFYLLVEVGDEVDWPAQIEDDANGSLGRMCQSIVEEWARPQSDGRLVELYLMALVHLIERLTDEQPIDEQQRLVQRAERLMAERSYEPLRIKDVARELNVSSSGLRAAFAALRDYAAKDYLQRMRAERALHMLQHGDAGLETIAAACGYDSASHLSRWMHRLHGCAPGALRRRGGASR